MLKKKSILVFAILTGLSLPVFSCLAGRYEIKFEAPGLLPKAAQYDGIVPCGKCVKIVDTNVVGPASPSSVNKGSLLPLVRQATEQQCSGQKGKDDFTQLYLDCQFCHIFIMLDGIIDFVLIDIVPLLAILMLVIGGVMFYMGGAKPEMVNRGKSLIRSVAIGLLLIYGAYMIIGTLLSVIGAAKFEAVNQVFKDGVFSIKCPIEMPAVSINP